MDFVTIARAFVVLGLGVMFIMALGFCVYLIEKTVEEETKILEDLTQYDE